MKYNNFINTLFALFCLTLGSAILEAKNLGHRMGGDKYKPENTLYCYKKALAHLQDKNDFLYVELDIQETKDGQIVVFHDTNSIKRLVPQSRHNLKILKDILHKKKFDKIQISDLTLSQTNKLSLEKNTHIPMLEEVLKASVKWKLRKPMLIEIKSLKSDKCRNDLISLVLKFTQSLDINFMAFHANFYQSFPDSLRWKSMFKKNGFKVYTAKKPKIDEFDFTKDASESVANWNFTTLLPEEPFVINSEKTRTLPFSIKLPKKRNKNDVLRIGIYHGYDDSGDKGVNFRLLDEEENLLMADSAKSKNWQWFEVVIGKNIELILYIEDYDTKLTGRYPGNCGSVKATLVSKGKDENNK